MLFKYEDYKNRLQVRICDRYSKEDFLKNKIVTYHGDFAAYYSIILGIGSEVEMISSMILLDSLLEQWNVTVEQIHADGGRFAQVIWIDGCIVDSMFDPWSGWKSWRKCSSRSC